MQFAWNLNRICIRLACFAFRLEYGLNDHQKTYCLIWQIILLNCQPSYTQCLGYSNLKWANGINGIYKRVYLPIYLEIFWEEMKNPTVYKKSKALSVIYFELFKSSSSDYVNFSENLIAYWSFNTKMKIHWWSILKKIIAIKMISLGCE